jgi:hypothetical protein
VFKLCGELVARPGPPYLHGKLHFPAEVVPDVFIRWQIDPWVLMSREQRLDAHDVRYLIVHRPSGTLGGLGEVDIAAGTGEVQDGLAGLGKCLDEVV